MGHNLIDACIGCASDRRFGGGGMGAGWRVLHAEDNHQSLFVNIMFISNAEHPRARRKFLKILRKSRNDSPGAL